MKVNRENLLKELESVIPGLSPKEVIEQSSCFVFQDNVITTFNDEIACSIGTALDIKGAVPAKLLLEVLRKVTDEEVEIKQKKGELSIFGKKIKCKIRMEEKIQLSVDSVDKPVDWEELPEGFSDAVSMVQGCASQDESRFELTCINICPEFIEACDGIQLARYDIKTNLKKPFLCRKDSLRHIVSMDMQSFSESKNWVHFKNSTGMVLSCRRFLDEAKTYPDLSKFLKVEGEKTQFPKNLKDTVLRAEIFSSDTSDENKVEIRIGNEKIKVIGRGVSGWLSETKGMKNYTGSLIQFKIPPRLFIELTQRFSEFIISKERIKVEGEKYQYLTCIEPIEDDESEE